MMFQPVEARYPERTEIQRSNDKMSLGKKASTSDAQRRAIVEAAQFLEENIDQRTPVEVLARKAGMSLFHFQRVFRAVVGESVAQHCIRLRLERAAYYLKFSAWQLQEVGLVAGFESQASFSKAFRRHYGMSPKTFREAEGVVPFLRSHMRSKKQTSEVANAYPSPTVRMEKWPDRRLIVLRYYGPVEGIYRPWAELVDWLKSEVIDLSEARFFGLWFDDWNSLESAKYRYECAVLLPGNRSSEIARDPFFTRYIPKGDVAISTIRGNVSAIDRAWRAMMYGWLPFSGYQPRLEFVLDEYPSALILAPGLIRLAKGLLPFDAQLCIPVTSETALL